MARAPDTPRRLNEQSLDPRVRAAHHATRTLFFARAVLRRHEAKITRHVPRSAKPRNVVQRRDKRGGRDWRDPRHGHEPPHLRIVLGGCSKPCVGGVELFGEEINDPTNGGECRGHRGRQGQRIDAPHKRLGHATPDAKPGGTRRRTGERDRPRPGLYELIAHTQLPLHGPLPLGTPMRGAVDPVEAGFRQGGDIPAFGLHAAGAIAVHRRIVRIRDGHVMSSTRRSCAASAQTAPSARPSQSQPAATIRQRSRPSAARSRLAAVFSRRSASIFAGSQRALAGGRYAVASARETVSMSNTQKRFIRVRTSVVGP